MSLLLLFGGGGVPSAAFPIDRSYIQLRASSVGGSTVYCFLVQRPNKTGYRISRSVTPSLLAPGVQLVLRAPGKIRMEQDRLFAPAARTDYGTLGSGLVWGTLAELEALWKAEDLEVLSHADGDFWDALCLADWDPKPMRRSGFLWMVDLTLESKEIV